MTEEYKTFAEYLYKTRQNWIKHVIPVSYLDSNLGVLLEAYITTPVKAAAEVEEEDTEEEEIELEEDKPVTIRLAFLSQYSNTSLKVEMSSLFPSNRKLTVVSDESRKTPGDIKLSPLYPEYVNNFKFQGRLDVENLRQVFETYKGLTWTMAELVAMVNSEIDDIVPWLEKNTNIDGTRICKITGMKANTFKLADVVGNEKIKKEFDGSHKVVESIDELYVNYSNCQKCDLGVQRVARGCNTVPSRGNKVNPDIFLIGEAPGGQEEEEGIPFNPKAPAGAILDKVITDAGIDKEKCYWTNSTICRPEQEEGKPGINGKPKNSQVSVCNTRLKNELAILKPKVVVVLGKTAYRAFFGEDPENVVKSVGWIECKNHKVYFVQHPSYIARQLNMTKGEDRERVKKEYLDHFIAVKSAI